MIDILKVNLERAKSLEHYKKINLEKESYALITIHRPSNVDYKEEFEKVIKIINYLQEKIKCVFPIHPRTKKSLKNFDLEESVKKENIILTEPIGYLEFLNLMQNSKLILTDSGGIQEEASYLKIPVLTVRKNTERPITIELGTNTLVGNDFERSKKYIDQILSNNYKTGQNIEKWDGNTSERIVNILKEVIN